MCGSKCPGGIAIDLVKDPDQRGHADAVDRLNMNAVIDRDKAATKSVTKADKPAQVAKDMQLQSIQ